MAGSLTPIGADTVTAVVRHYILPTITDNVYNANPILFRVNKSKRFIAGGTRIEFPLMYARFTNGGAYEGLDVLNITPSDTVKNGAVDWRQYYVAIAIDGRTLIKADAGDGRAIANIIRLQSQQAEMEMAENLGTALWGSNTGGTGKEIDGLDLAIDSTSNYAGLSFSSNPWWSSQEYPTNEPLTLDNLNSKLFSYASEGGRHPSIIVSRQNGYDQYWKIATSKQSILQAPISYDEQLFAGGFTNLLFNGIPWVVDPHVPNTATGTPGVNALGTDIHMLNEDYIFLAVSPRGDMQISDFQEPINQDAMAAKMLWAGNLVVTNRARHAKATGLQNAA